MLQKVAATTKANFSQMEVHYFVDPQVSTSSYSLYSDDGETPHSYSSGKYEKLNILAKHSKKQTNLTFTPEVGKNYKEAMSKSLVLTIHNLSKKPKRILVNGTKQRNWKWENGEAALSLTVPTTSITKVTLN